MRIDKRTLNASPFVGVFAILTDRVLLLPQNTLDKELRGLEKLTGTEVFKATAASSPLLGVLGVGSGGKIAFSELAREQELDSLREIGLKAERIKGITAPGNLVCVTEKAGIVSPVISAEQRKALSSFFGVEMLEAKVAGLDLAGASVVATSKGFIAHPKVSDSEFAFLKKVFGTDGIPTTANYGDRFVGNSVLANSECALVGLNTTGHELIRIEEAFHG